MTFQLPSKIYSRTFLRAQANSLAATGLDFAVTIGLTELCGLWCVTSSAIGRVSGGVFNFAVGRYWVYNSRNENKYTQLVKYTISWVINFFLNIGGMYVLTDLFLFNYMLSKIVVAILFGVFVNYIMQKKYVFKP